MHGRHQSRAPYGAQIRPWDRHTHCHDVWIGVDDAGKTRAHIRHHVSDAVIGHWRQLVDGERGAIEVEHTDLHNGAGEFHTNHMESFSGNAQSNGTAISLAANVTGLLDRMRIDKTRADLGHRRGRETKLLRNLRARFDTAAIKHTQHMGSVELRNP